MISIFKKHEPAYKRIVRRFALDIWHNLDRVGAFDNFMNRAKSFKIRYERDLVEYYEDKKIKIYRGTIREKANQWLNNQVNIAESVEIIAKAKRDKIKDELFQDFVKTGSPDAQELLNKVYLSESEQKAGGKVLKVFSFADNLEDKAEQIGSQAAFDLGDDINHEVISGLGEKYEWRTQEDRQVRSTHRQLNGKAFLYSDPPTTVDQYGKEHKGHPGTDWGCVTGSTKIIFDSQIKTLYRRFYFGKMVSITTSSGIKLNLTQNHPVLTDKGWINAKFIDRTYNLVKIPEKMFNSREININYRIASAEEIFNSFSLRFPPYRVRGLRSNFHNDGINNQKISIIRPDWKLMNISDIMSVKFFGNFFFSNANKFWMFKSISSFCNFISKFFSLFFAASCLIRMFCKILFFVICKFFHPNIVGLRSASYLNIIYNKIFKNKSSTEVIFPRTGEKANTGDIIKNNIFNRNVHSFDSVRFVRHKLFLGFVYNFETETNVYYANLLASHNCRCYEVPTNKKPLRNYKVRW